MEQIEVTESLGLAARQGFNGLATEDVALAMLDDYIQKVAENAAAAPPDTVRTVLFPIAHEVGMLVRSYAIVAACKTGQRPLVEDLVMAVALNTVSAGKAFPSRSLSADAEALFGPTRYC